MTTLSDLMNDLIQDAVKLGQESPPDLEDKKQELLTEYIEYVINRWVGA